MTKGQRTITANQKMGNITKEGNDMAHEISKAGCSVSPSGEGSRPQKKLVAYAANRLQKEIFGWC